jgi:hypothetical protein
MDLALHVPCLLLCKNCFGLEREAATSAGQLSRKPTAFMAALQLVSKRFANAHAPLSEQTSQSTHQHCGDLTKFPNDKAKTPRDFCNGNANKSGAQAICLNEGKDVTKTPATLAKQIEREMHRASKSWAHYENEHCALFENDLGFICPENVKDRRKKLAEFAAQYGFRLRFYSKGLFAIFAKRMQPVANDVGAFWPVARQALSTK